MLEFYFRFHFSRLRHHRHVILHLASASVTKQYNLVPAKGMGVTSLAGKVTVGLVESNGSLAPGL